MLFMLGNVSEFIFWRRLAGLLQRMILSCICHLVVSKIYSFIWKKVKWYLVHIIYMWGPLFGGIFQALSSREFVWHWSLLLYKLYLFIWNWFHVVSRLHDPGYVGPPLWGSVGGKRSRAVTADIHFLLCTIELNMLVWSNIGTCFT